MAQERSYDTMFDELLQEYVERYHEDADIFNPDAYEEELRSMDDEDLETLYLETFSSD